MTENGDVHLSVTARVEITEIIEATSISTQLLDNMLDGEEAISIEQRRYRRPFDKDHGLMCLNAFAKRIFDDIDPKILSDDIDGTAETLSVESCKHLASNFGVIWTENGKESQFALEGLMVLLERSLSQKRDNYGLFNIVMQTLGDSTALKFLQTSAPYFVECDARNGTDYVELFMCYLVVYQTRTNIELAKKFIAAVPHFGDMYLNTNEKTFHEIYSLGKVMEQRVMDAHGSIMVIVFPRCLSWLHFTPRRVVVSNAPPVRLRRKPVKSKVTYECATAAGGLVTGVLPCMRAEDLWVGFIEDTVLGMNRLPLADLAKRIKASDIPTKLQRSPSIMKATLSEASQEEDSKVAETLWAQTELDVQRMQRMLDSYAEKNFVVNPLIIMRQEHKPYYNGISNGLFWPAFHNLLEFIIDEYKKDENGKTLEYDWLKYVKVNHYFALHTARSCRSQDFLWIHDYHLFLVGGILRSISPDVQCGFFLHIPYLLPPSFFDDYREQALAVLRGLLAFSRVGFQTERDVDNFLADVQKYIPSAKVISEREYKARRRVFTVFYNDWTVDVGAFGISIKTEQLLEWSRDEELIEEGMRLKRHLLEKRPPGSRLFVSVERLDYTKGIQERLLAFQRYLRQLKNNGETRRDVYYQIASSSRADVSSYIEYKKRIMKIADEINAEFEGAMTIDCENHPHREVTRYYIAADVIVITPLADGMNLVVKEAIIVNPKAAIVLSTGAGAENQFAVAGLSDCYFRVTDVKDTETFANTLQEAAMADPAFCEERGRRLYEFVKENDIQKWLDDYLDDAWYHEVIHQKKLTSVQQFQDMMIAVRDHRRSIVKCMLRHQPFKETSALSLGNAKKTLEEMLREAENDSTVNVNGVDLNVKDELDLLAKDCRFLNFYKEDNDIDGLIDYLAESHPNGKPAFTEEMNSVMRMLNLRMSNGIDVFITDWDGTMKTYATSYRTSVQPAYSAVILSLFANRYTKLAAVLTAGPLRDFGILDLTTVPWEDGYLTIGGSWGREWLIDGKRVADEKILTIEGAAALAELTERIHRIVEQDEFKNFTLIGSGVQRKVDRITVGIQNVTGRVDNALSQRYMNAVIRELDDIDPKHRLFEVIQLDLELELALKQHTDGHGKGWTKADGIRFMLENVGVDLSNGNVLICGDTVSDLPMVETAIQLNPDHTYVVFVNPNKEVKQKLKTMLPEEQYVVVGCPEVLHAAMAKQILRPMFVVNEL